MVYQMMFAVITPALIIGAFAERMKFSAFLVFAVLWATLVYDPLAHWIWGAGGWLREYGALDFAGGAVVHISAGMAALAAALVVGKRRGYPDTGAPHNLAFVVLGAALLWFGWFGFNGGSALSSGATRHPGLRHHATRRHGRGPRWMVLDWVISQAAHHPGLPLRPHRRSGGHHPGRGLRRSAGGSGHRRHRRRRSATCAVMIVKSKFKYDDSLDAFGIHGIAGMWGILAVGLWASLSFNSAGADGLFHGHGHQLLVQFVTVVGHGGLLVRGLVRPPQAGGQDHGPARQA